MRKQPAAKPAAGSAFSTIGNTLRMLYDRGVVIASETGG
jgi:hypothetical protein